MTEADISLLIQTYGLWVIFVLTVVEGPIVTILAGALAGKAVLSAPAVLVLAYLGDLLGDCVLYAIGRGSPRLTRRLVRRPADAGFDEARAFVHRRSWQMLVLGKWTHALGFAVILAAGAARVPFGLFFLVSAFATVPKVLLLFLLGFVFGQAVDLVWIVIAALIGALGVGLLTLRTRRAG